MKTSSLPRVALLAVALGTAGVTASLAQTTPAPTTTPATPAETTGPKHHHHHSILTADERTQLKQAREIAFAADPSLKTEGESLKAKFHALKSQSPSAPKNDWAALRTQGQAYHTKLRAAELKADPNLAPVFTKIDTARAQHGHHHSST